MSGVSVARARIQDLRGEGGGPWRAWSANLAYNRSLGARDTGAKISSGTGGPEV